MSSVGVGQGQQTKPKHSAANLKSQKNRDKAQTLYCQPQCTKMNPNPPHFILSIYASTLGSNKNVSYQYQK